MIKNGTPSVTAAEISSTVNPNLPILNCLCLVTGPAQILTILTVTVSLLVFNICEVFLLLKFIQN